MEIYTIGYNHAHGKDFVIDRQNGSDSWLFLLIKTPAVFIENGVERVLKGNSFVLFSPNTPQYYKAKDEKYVDDWVHFNALDEDAELFTSLEIPLNTVTSLGDVAELSSLMRKIAFEHSSPSPYKADITDLYMKILFVKLGGILKTGENSTFESVPERYESMVNLRTKIYNSPQSVPPVDDMAQELSMSRSGFQHTYKKIFGVNVMSDVIASRLQRAKFLLVTTTMTLPQIAEQSGYTSEFHLIRQFKQKYGCTPTQFRSVL